MKWIKWSHWWSQHKWQLNEAILRIYAFSAPLQYYVCVCEHYTFIFESNRIYIVLCRMESIRKRPRVFVNSCIDYWLPALGILYIQYTKYRGVRYTLRVYEYVCFVLFFFCCITVHICIFGKWANHKTLAYNEWIEPRLSQPICLSMYNRL